MSICRHCGTSLRKTFIDLGFAPPSNAYLQTHDFNKSELYFPLRVFVCESCWLVQTEDFADVSDLFNNEYAYFSSTSTSWLKHAADYMAKISNELDITVEKFVVEIASNDGYLLKNFVAHGIPCLGIEPTDSTADAAEKHGVPVLRDFFGKQLGEKLAIEGKQADLIVGNNVYAHVPNINDFTSGLQALLKPGGTITLEFPHLLRLIESTQFDTIYHEHYSYFSLFTVDKIFRAAGLRIWNVEELLTHGGSLRIYGCHGNDLRKTAKSVGFVLDRESRFGLQQLEPYLSFQSKANKVKNDLVSFLIEQKRQGKKVAAYGAAAKGNTLLNYAGIKSDLLPFVCDAAESKQNKFLPGSHIPILSPAVLEEEVLDYLLVLPWNIAGEIKQQNIRLAEVGTQFITAVPELTII